MMLGRLAFLLLGLSLLGVLLPFPWERFAIGLACFVAGMYARWLWLQRPLFPFLRKVSPPLAFSLIVTCLLAFCALWGAIGNPRVVECIKAGAVYADIESHRKHGYMRTFQFGDCTVYFHASNKDEYFR